MGVAGSKRKVGAGRVKIWVDADAWQLRCCVGRTGFESPYPRQVNQNRPLRGLFWFTGGEARPLRTMLRPASGSLVTFEGGGNKKKPPCGGFLKFEDAKVGLLVSFF